MPVDIPDSVMMAAMRAVNDAIFRIAHDEVHIMGHTDRKTEIARAILAAKAEERTDIAKMAEEFGMAAGEPALVIFAGILRKDGAL